MWKRSKSAPRLRSSSPRACCRPNVSLDSFGVVSDFRRSLLRAQTEPDPLTCMVYNEFKLRLPELLLMRVDKIGMSTSIEARVPFLDHELVGFTMDIPIADKIRG